MSCLKTFEKRKIQLTEIFEPYLPPIVRIQFMLKKINCGLLNQHIPFANSTLHGFLEI